MSDEPSIYGFTLAVIGLSLLGGAGLTGIVYALVWALSQFNVYWIEIYVVMSVVAGLIAWQFRAYEVVERGS